MRLKKIIISLFVVAFITTVFTPTPVNAGFFLFNIFSSKKNETPTLVKYGMKGKDVVMVQTYLINTGFLEGKADGVFGMKTLRAVRDFQSTVHISADGIVGVKTIKALKEFKGKKPKPPTTSPSSDKKDFSYSYVVSMVATAYTRYDEGCTNYTYRGNYLRRGLVAVDPNVIPLGTRLYVPGYGYAVADDIGGAIQGNRIDLAMDTLDEAFDYGVRNVNVYVLK